MDFPDANSISGPAEGTRRQVGSPLNGLILDVCDSQLINDLQGQAVSCALFVSSSMAQAQDPAIDQIQSRAKHFAQSAASELCQPQVSPPRSNNGSDSVGRNTRRSFSWEQLPALMDESVHFPELLALHWLCSDGVFFSGWASITAVSQHSSSPN